MSVAARIKYSSRVLLPQAFIMFVLTISLLPLRLPGFAEFIPLFSAITIFYWCIFCPRLFPVWFVFLLGLYQDILYGNPLGVVSLCNIMLFVFVNHMRRWLLEQSFVALWLGFAAILLSYSIAYGIITMLVFQPTFSVSYALMQWFLTVSIYPCFHALYSFMFTKVLDNGELTFENA